MDLEKCTAEIISTTLGERHSVIDGEPKVERWLAVKFLILDDDGEISERNIAMPTDSTDKAVTDEVKRMLEVFEKEREIGAASAEVEAATKNADELSKKLAGKVIK